MSVRLYIKDLLHDTVHEYGTNPHDCLMLREDGAIDYLNLQTGDGTGPHGSYKFCFEDGSSPYDFIRNIDADPILDIGGIKEDRPADIDEELLRRILEGEA